MMRRRMLLILAVAVLGSLLVTGIALAMASDHYRLDWFTPLTGTGMSAQSTHYGVDLSIGQTVIGTASSTSREACLGYWCVATTFRLYLPLVIRAH